MMRRFAFTRLLPLAVGPDPDVGDLSRPAEPATAKAERCALAPLALPTEVKTLHVSLGAV